MPIQMRKMPEVISAIARTRVSATAASAGSMKAMTPAAP
jgi:hypothetical protein